MLSNTPSQEEFLLKAEEQGISRDVALKAYQRNTQQTVTELPTETPQQDTPEQSTEIPQQDTSGVPADESKKQRFLEMAEKEGFDKETATRAYERNEQRLQSQRGNKEILAAPEVDIFEGYIEAQKEEEQLDRRLILDELPDYSESPGVGTATHYKERKLITKYKQFLSPNTSALELMSLIDSQSAEELKQLNQQIATDVVNAATKAGLNIAYESGKYYTITEQGEKLEVSPTMLGQVWENRLEITGGIGGGILGFAALKKFGIAGRLAGSIFGAALGSFSGSILDQSVQAMELQEELQAKIALEKGLSAAKVSAITDSLFVAGLKAGQFTYRSIAVVWDHVKDGNKSGAIQAMKHQFNITDEAEINEIIAKWENLNKTEIPGDADQKALVAVTMTQPGGENIVRTAAQLDPVASATVLNDVRKRAETLIDAVDAIPSEQSAREIGKAIRQYELDVDKFYDSVKREFTELPIPKGSLQDIDADVDNMITRIRRSLSIDKVDEGRFLSDLEPDLRAALARLQSGEAIGEELLDVRRVLTGLQYSKAISDTPSKQAISGVIKKLDEATEAAAKHNMGDAAGQEWIDNWKGKGGALQQYSEKLQFKDNVIYKAIIKQGFNHKSASRALINYADTVDDAYFSSNSYKEFRRHLGTKAAKEIEGQISKDLVERHALNKIGEVRAINFPALAQDMNRFDFIDPEATKVKKVVSQLAEVYRNDAKLMRASGFVNLEEFQSYLTTNPVTRAKYWLASKSFNYIQRVSGGGKSDARALVTLVGEFLEAPLNTKSTKELLKEVGDDIDMKKSIEELQKVIAREKVDDLTGMTVIYKTSKGTLSAKQSGKEAARIPTHRLIPEKQVMQMYGLKKLTSKTLTTQVRRALIDQGAQAITLSDGSIIKLFD